MCVVTGNTLYHASASQLFTGLNASHLYATLSYLRMFTAPEPIRAEYKAATLTRLDRSAPLKPGVAFAMV